MYAILKSIARWQYSLLRLGRFGCRTVVHWVPDFWQQQTHTPSSRCWLFWMLRLPRSFKLVGDKIPATLRTTAMISRRDLRWKSLQSDGLKDWSPCAMWRLKLLRQHIFYMYLFPIRRCMYKKYWTGMNEWILCFQIFRSR